MKLRFLCTQTIYMNKTVHRTITQKTFKAPTAAPITHKTYITQAECSDMNTYLQAAATDLLQPRDEAVARILEMARRN